MATRPIFMPDYDGRFLVLERSFDFPWSSGFSESQKKKNVAALHKAAREQGISRILEISTKSSEEVGRRLSAFSLKIGLDDKKFPLESVYQGSKMFKRGGPHPDIFHLSPREAKRFVREGEWGELMGFRLQGSDYPLIPKNAFYDWLYIRSIEPHASWIQEKVIYDAFTDIEFNPAKQVNCQARAFAEFQSLLKLGKLHDAAQDFNVFVEILNPENQEIHAAE